MHASDETAIKWLRKIQAVTLSKNLTAFSAAGVFIHCISFICLYRRVDILIGPVSLDPTLATLFPSATAICRLHAILTEVMAFSVLLRLRSLMILVGIASSRPQTIRVFLALFVLLILCV